MKLVVERGWRGRRRSKTHRVLGAAICSLVVCIAAAGCGSDSSGGSDSQSSIGADKKLGLSLNCIADYTKNLATGMGKAIDGTAYGFKAVQANCDANTELTNIESLIDQGMDGLVINPNTTEGVLPAVKRAKEQGIPVGLAFWTGPSPLDNYLTSVAHIDSVSMGRELGEWIKANGKPGPTIVVQGVLGQGYSEALDKGLDEALAGSGFDVVAREQGFFDRSKAVTVVEAALQAHPDATTIVDYSPAMGNGISAFLKTNKIDNITHATVSVDEEMFQWLGTPYLSAAVYYSSAEAGQLVTDGVRAALEGGKPVFQNDVFHAIATKDNVDQLIKDHPYRYPEFAAAVPIS